MLVGTIAKILDVAEENVEFKGIEDVTGEAEAAASLAAAAAAAGGGGGGGSVRVSYEVTAAIESVGAGFQDATEAASFLTSALEFSISSGGFSSELQDLAAELQVDILAEVTTTSVLVVEVVVSVGSPAPSLAPSLSPTAIPEPNAAGDDGIVGLEAVTAIIILVAIVAAFCCCVGVALVFKDRKPAPEADVELQSDTYAVVGTKDGGHPDPDSDPAVSQIIEDDDFPIMPLGYED